MYRAKKRYKQVGRELNAETLDKRERNGQVKRDIQKLLYWGI